MKVHKKALGSLIMILSAMGLSAQMAAAQSFVEEPLRSSSIPEVVDENTRMNEYFRVDSILGDTEFVFGLSYGDIATRRAAKQTEALYYDLLEQQDNDNPTVRTPDLPSPFTTSIFTLQSPANFSQFGQ